MKLKKESVSIHDGRVVVYMQILDDNDAIVEAFDVYYNPKDQQAFVDYCNARLQEAITRKTEMLQAASTQIDDLLGGT